MSWKLYYANPDGTGEQNVNLESLGVLEGGAGCVTGDGIRFRFSSHKPSEVTIKVPGIDPKLTPKIPFMSRVRIVDSDGVQKFVGRRIDWDGVASPGKSGITYTFQDAWWDMSKITFKHTWWTGGYMPVTYDSVHGKFTLHGPYFVPGLIGYNMQANFYDANKNQIGSQFIPHPSSGSYMDFTVTGGSGAFATAKYVSFLHESTDTVLFQYMPGDPYQPGASGIHFYITTGQQIEEILNFAIARGVWIQIGTIDPSLYAPWYPVRCQNCAEVIRVCLRYHPDCFTEIDYSTSPPTVNILKSDHLEPQLLPYAYTTVGGQMMLTTDIKPRPDLIPTRIAIYYRYLVSGQAISWPQDIYPADAPDGILATDYSIDLHGAAKDFSWNIIESAAFEPTTVDWWKTKCNHLKNPAIVESSLHMINRDGSTYDGSDLTILEDDGTPIDASVYHWELVSGNTQKFGSGFEVKTANLTTYFDSQRKNSSGALEWEGVHPETTRVTLVNTDTVAQSFSQYSRFAEGIPENLARNIYESLQGMVYNLRQSNKDEPFTEFIKPGKHSVNLHGGNAEWETMATPVQESSYTLYQRGDGIVWSMSDVSCGPVNFLEAGQLVQLFNIFANRDILKIDPWERVTGNAETSSSANGDQAVKNPKENSTPGVPNPIFTTHMNTVVDANGHLSVVITNTKASGISIMKWDKTSVDGSSIPTPVSEKPGFILDLTDISNIISAAGTATPVTGYSADDIWKLKAREVKACDDSGNQFYVIGLFGGGYTKS